MILDTLDKAIEKSIELLQQYPRTTVENIKDFKEAVNAIVDELLENEAVLNYSSEFFKAIILKNYEKANILYTFYNNLINDCCRLSVSNDYSFGMIIFKKDVIDAFYRSTIQE